MSEEIREDYSDSSNYTKSEQLRNYPCIMNERRGVRSPDNRVTYRAIWMYNSRVRRPAVLVSNKSTGINGSAHLHRRFKMYDRERVPRRCNRTPSNLHEPEVSASETRQLCFAY